MSRERDNSEALKIVAETIIGDKEGKNIVFVFGAGASIESGMAPTPLLKDSVKGFLLALRDTEHGKNIQKNLSRKFNVDMETVIDMASLEYLISIGCEVFGEKQMLNWLKQYIPDIYSTDIRYFAPISYEFVAHLMGQGVFSADSERLAYGVNLNQKWWLIVDGNDHDEHDDIKHIIFSPNSKRLAYVAKHGDKELVVIDEKKEKEYDGLSIFSSALTVSG